MHDPDSKPSIFIGSSTEGKRVAEFLQCGLDDAMEATIWSQGVFGLSDGSLASLVQATADFEFAALVLTPDDLVRKRDAVGNAPRDNVLLELGLFIGALGRSRTFIVYPADQELALPSDLAGVTAATYRSRKDDNLQAALGTVCTQIKVAARKALGISLRGSGHRKTVEMKREPVARRRRRRSLGIACVAGPRQEHRVVDISVSGALLETGGKIPVGRELKLDLRLDATRRARVTAKVVRVQEPAWGVVGAVGVAFTKFEHEAKHVIGQYVLADDERHRTT